MLIFVLFWKIISFLLLLKFISYFIAWNSEISYRITKEMFWGEPEVPGWLEMEIWKTKEDFGAVNKAQNVGRGSKSEQTLNSKVM